MPTPPRPQPVALRIELRDAVPLVWRRVLVSNQWTLASLHHYLQWVMDWRNAHAHEFHVGQSVAAPDWWIDEIGLDEETGDYRDERRVSVAAVVSELGSRGEFEYRYDMGDGWQHRLVLEFLPPSAATQDLSLPVCWPARTPVHQKISAARTDTRCFSKSLETQSMSSTTT